MTDVPVAEAAERLRTALANVNAGRKAKLYPADVRALLDFYDRQCEPAAPAEPDLAETATKQPEQTRAGNPRLDELEDSLKGLLGAVDRMMRPGFDPNLMTVLIPFADAILAVLNREINGIRREKVENANEAYKDLDVVKDDAAVDR